MSYNCPKCGSEFQKGTKFCQTCGCNLALEYIEQPVCPTCKISYPTNTKFCVNDGSKLVRPEDLIPKCVKCHTPYSDDIKFCPRDGGEVKIILTRHLSQFVYGERQPYQGFNVNHRYPKASLGDRFLAALLDSLITTGLSIPAITFFILGIEEDSDGFFIFGFILYLIPLIYTFIKDGLGQGQSWGKKALDIMVVKLENKMPCDKRKSFFRNFVSGLITIIPIIGWLIEPIMVLATDDGRKLGDRAANTQVIDKRNF